MLYLLQALLRETACTAAACNAFLDIVRSVGPSGTDLPRLHAAMMELHRTVSTLQSATDEGMSVLHGLCTPDPLVP